MRIIFVVTATARDEPKRRVTVDDDEEVTPHGEVTTSNYIILHFSYEIPLCTQSQFLSKPSSYSSLTAGKYLIPALTAGHALSYILAIQDKNKSDQTASFEQINKVAL